MPIFESMCPKCGTSKEFYTPKFTEKNPKCAGCGGKTVREISTPVFHDFYQLTKTTAVSGYNSRHIAGEANAKEIRTHKQLADECKKHGVVPAWGKESRIG